MITKFEDIKKRIGKSDVRTNQYTMEKYCVNKYSEETPILVVGILDREPSNPSGICYFSEWVSFTDFIRCFDNVVYYRFTFFNKDFKEIPNTINGFVEQERINRGIVERMQLPRKDMAYIEWLEDDYIVGVGRVWFMAIFFMLLPIHGKWGGLVGAGIATLYYIVNHFGSTVPWKKACKENEEFNEYLKQGLNKRYTIVSVLDQTFGIKNLDYKKLGYYK